METPAVYRGVKDLIAPALIAVGVVAIIWLFTNHMRPEWDMAYYIDMAANGIVGNGHLAAPFAYRIGAPLLVGALAHLTGVGPELTFRICDAISCVIFVLSCFYFARALGASFYAAAFSGIILALNFNVVKWTLFSGTMVDIYAYPFLLAAFWALLREKFYLCLLISSVGLLFKEFLLVPLFVQAAALLLEQRRLSDWKRWGKPLLLSGLSLLVFFVLPRLFIHVAHTFQDIDPLNDRSTVRRLLTYPLSRRHDFNILFAYLAGWLPVLLLALTPARLRLIAVQLRPYRLTLVLFMAFHFLLTMYGGTNINIYITYCVPIQVVVLVILLDRAGVPVWEICAAVLVVFTFNRIWKTIPLPQNGLDTYLDFYAGYYMRVNSRSFFRMGELLTYIIGFSVLRFSVIRFSGAQTGIPSESQPRPLVRSGGNSLVGLDEL